MKRFLLVAFVLAAAFSAAAEEYALNKASQWQLVRKNKALQKGESLVFSGGVEALSVREFEVNGKKSGTFTAEIRTDSKTRLPGITMGMVLEDKSGNKIYIMHYRYIPNSLTSLAAPVKLMDRSIKVKAAKPWKKAKGRLVAFEAKADDSDLPTNKLSIPILSTKEENGITTVNFAGPLFTELPAGTLVRLHMRGSFYFPCPTHIWYNWAENNWKKVGGSFKIPSWAVAIRPMIVYHGAKVKEKSFEMRNIKLKFD